MRSNPGGEIAPSEVVGREDLVDRVWDVLTRQSILLTAERRMGKSCLLKKMKAEPAPGTIPIYRDLEGLDTPIRFVERVYEDVARYLGRLRRTADGVHTLLRHLCGLEMPGIRFPIVAAPHWKDLLERTLADLARHQDDTVVFFWDEIPMMLDKIRRASGERTALDLLDCLRAARQQHPRLRMVLTGSVGLHHVVRSLRGAGALSDATNDLRRIELPPLDPVPATELARRLIRGEGIDCEDETACARAIAASVDRIPYYIHHVVAGLAGETRPVHPEVIVRHVRDELSSPSDPWHLAHFRERIDEYYAPERRATALFALDEIALDGPLEIDSMRRRIASSVGDEDDPISRAALSGDERPLVALLEDLERDHYIAHHVDGYRFRFELVRLYWCHSRGLPLGAGESDR